MSQVAPIGSSCGLVLSWRLGVDLECFVKNKNNIYAWCFSDPPHSLWILSCIYGPPDRRERMPFWDSFESIGFIFKAPWLCIGDFNYVLEQLIHGAIIDKACTLSMKDWTGVLLPLTGSIYTLNTHCFTSMPLPLTTISSLSPQTSPLVFYLDLLDLRNSGPKIPPVVLLLKQPG
jgi:hypothetical protein